MLVTCMMLMLCDATMSSNLMQLGLLVWRSRI